MNIELISKDHMNPAPYNPRINLQPTDSEYQKLAKSIEEFGYIEPIVWNRRTGSIVGGHQRFKILVANGEELIASSVVDLDETKEKALNIALNKISGHWDDEKLAYLLTEIQQSDIDISLTGFDSLEVVEFLDNFNKLNEEEGSLPVVEDEFNVQKALDNIITPETKYGDVWQLGRHLLMCGDATNRKDVQRLMSGSKSDLIVTDPPYNVNVKSKSARLNEDNREKIMNDDMPAEQFVGFLEMTFNNYVSIMSPAAAIYVFHSSSFQREFENAMNSVGIKIRTQCIWSKNASSFGFSQYKYKHEPVFYAHLESEAPSWYGDLKQTTIWKSGLPVEQSIPETIWEVSRGDVTKYVHPTQKPLELLAIPIKNSSKKGDIIVDFFGGSGSTLMTCEQMDRECRVLELDPIFCDVIKQRFFESTNIEPFLISQ